MSFKSWLLKLLFKDIHNSINYYKEKCDSLEETNKVLGNKVFELTNAIVGTVSTHADEAYEVTMKKHFASEVFNTVEPFVTDVLPLVNEMASIKDEYLHIKEELFELRGKGLKGDSNMVNLVKTVTSRITSMNKTIHDFRNIQLKASALKSKLDKISPIQD